MWTTQIVPLARTDIYLKREKIVNPISSELRQRSCQLRTPLWFVYIEKRISNKQIKKSRIKGWSAELIFDHPSILNTYEFLNTSFCTTKLCKKFFHFFKPIATSNGHCSQRLLIVMRWKKMMIYWGAFMRTMSAWTNARKQQCLIEHRREAYD